jgi:dynein intermediate chain
VCDVQWSPVHPALFATVDGSGDLAVWNINQSLEEPTARVTVDAQHALHKVAWHADGRILAVGDASGKTHLFDVLDDVAVPASDESERFERTVKQLLLDQNQLN